MKLSRLLPRYYAKTDNIRQLFEALDTVFAEDDILYFFDNISVETNLVELKTKIVDYLTSNFYGTRVKNLSLTETDKINICTIFSILEDIKGNINVIHTLYKRFGWIVVVTKINADTWRVLPSMVAAPGTEEDFNLLASRLNPFLERYYLPVGIFVTSPLGSAVIFPTYKRTVTTTFTYAVHQHFYAHRFFGNEQILNDNPLEFVDTDYNYAIDFEVVVSP